MSVEKKEHLKRHGGLPPHDVGPPHVPCKVVTRKGQPKAHVKHLDPRTGKPKT